MDVAHDFGIRRDLRVRLKVGQRERPKMKAIGEQFWHERILAGAGCHLTISSSAASASESAATRGYAVRRSDDGSRTRRVGFEKPAAFTAKRDDGHVAGLTPFDAAENATWFGFTRSPRALEGTSIG